MRIVFDDLRKRGLEVEIHEKFMEIRFIGEGTGYDRTMALKDILDDLADGCGLSGPERGMLVEMAISDIERALITAMLKNS